MTRENSVWVPPSATSFSCLCETCLDIARNEGASFIEAVRRSNVRGDIPVETNVGFVRCSSGHEVVVRRVDRPIPQHNPRQMQLV